MEWKKIVAIVGTLILLGSLAWTTISINSLNESKEQLNDAATQLDILQKSNDNLESNIKILNETNIGLGLEIVNLTEQTESDAIIKADYEVELALIAEEEAIEAEEKIIANAGHDLDEFNLAQTVTEQITENDYEILLDSEVEFDNDDYDFEEVLSFIATSDINGDDYNENSFLVFDEGDIEYKLIFDNDLNTSLINEDETLKVNFLGNELEITSWDINEITIEVGEDFLLNVGDNIIYNDKVVTLVFASDEEVLVDVDRVMDSIKEDESEDINGLSIKLDFAAEGEMAKIVISDEDSETVIESGDEFAEDSMWEYLIIANEIGLISVEEFSDIDEDSDYKALAATEFVSLPNEYLSLTYNGIKSVDMVDVDFSEKNGFVKIKGEFVSGLNDYDLVYVNATGFYDEDYTFISNASVEIDDTDSLIELNNNTLVVEDVVLDMDFSDVEVNGNSIASKDDNYRSSFGIVIESPEDNLEDEELSISVPEERVEVSITVN